jgi:hypothetical protein
MSALGLSRPEALCCNNFIVTAREARAARWNALTVERRRRRWRRLTLLNTVGGAAAIVVVWAFPFMPTVPAIAITAIAVVGPQTPGISTPASASPGRPARYLRGGNRGRPVECAGEDSDACGLARGVWPRNGLDSGC